MEIKYLSDKDDWNNTIEEELGIWIKKTLLGMGLDLDKIYGQDKGKAISYLQNNKVSLTYNIPNKSMTITKDGKFFAYWGVKSISPKIDDKDWTLYNEITVTVKDKTF